jgi:hypothetical protein
MWRIWAKALGEKASADSKQADKVALIRTIIFLQVVVTNILICVNIIITWIK